MNGEGIVGVHLSLDRDGHRQRVQITVKTDWKAFMSAHRSLWLVRAAALGLAASMGWAADTAAAPQGSGVTVRGNNAVLEVLKLSRAKVGEDTIVDFIKRSGAVYELSAEDLVQLHNEGVSDRVLSAMLASRSAAPAIPPAPVVTPPPPASPAPTSQPVVAAPAGQTDYPGGVSTQPVPAPATTVVQQPAVTYVQAPPTYVQAAPTVVYAPPVVTSYYYGSPYYYGVGHGWGYPRSGISVSLGFGGGFRGGYFGGYHGGFHGGHSFHGGHRR